MATLIVLISVCDKFILMCYEIVVRRCAERTQHCLAAGSTNSAKNVDMPTAACYQTS